MEHTHSPDGVLLGDGLVLGAGVLPAEFDEFEGACELFPELLPPWLFPD